MLSESALRYGGASHRQRLNCTGTGIYSLKRGCSREIRLGSKPWAERHLRGLQRGQKKRTGQNEELLLRVSVRGCRGRPGQRSRQRWWDLLRVSPLRGAAEGAGVRVAAVSHHHPHLHHRGELRGPRTAGFRDVRQSGDARTWSVLRIKYY